MERFLPQDTNVSLSFNLHKIVFTFSWETMARSLRVLGKIVENLLYSGNWGILWYILIAGFILRRENQFDMERKILLFNIAAILFLFYCGYSFTQYSVWILENDSSVSRNLIHFFPLVTILIVLFLCPKAEENSS